MIEGMPERDERPWEPCQMNRQELAMGTHLAMGTLHMSVQRGNETAVGAGGCSSPAQALSSRCSYLRGRCVPTKSPLPVRRKSGVLTLDAMWTVSYLANLTGSSARLRFSTVLGISRKMSCTEIEAVISICA